jgi:hypothetical protein
MAVIREETEISKLELDDFIDNMDDLQQQIPEEIYAKDSMKPIST